MYVDPEKTIVKMPSSEILEAIKNLQAAVIARHLLRNAQWAAKENGTFDVTISFKDKTPVVISELKAQHEIYDAIYDIINKCRGYSDMIASSAPYIGGDDIKFNVSKKLKEKLIAYVKEKHDIDIEKFSDRPENQPGRRSGGWLKE